MSSYISYGNYSGFFDSEAKGQFSYLQTKMTEWLLVAYIQDTCLDILGNKLPDN